MYARFGLAMHCGFPKEPILFANQRHAERPDVRGQRVIGQRSEVRGQETAGKRAVHHNDCIIFDTLSKQDLRLY